MPGLWVLSCSRLRVKRRTSSPGRTEQGAKPSDAVVQEPSKTKAPGRRGRPPGSQHRHRREVALSPSLRVIQEPIKRWLEQIGEACKVVAFLGDGELGHNDARHMGKQGGLQLLSQLRYNCALYCPYEGPDCGRGPHRKYGQKGDSPQIPSPY